MGLGFLGGKFYPLDFGSPLRRKHLFYFGAGAFSRAAVWQGQRFRVKHGQRFWVFVRGSGFVFWRGQWFNVLTGAAVSYFGGVSGFVFWQGL